MDYNKLIKIANIIKEANDKKQILSYHIYHALRILSLDSNDYYSVKKCVQLVDNYNKNKILPDNYSLVCDFIKKTGYHLTKNETIYLCGIYI